MAWRNCKASLVLVEEVNARWPRRDKASDGTIGDAAHATRTSDHNPWVTVAGTGVVRARDIDKDGIDAAWLAEHLRQLGAKGDPRLAGGGYIIFNRRITKPDFSGWRVYTGSNPHTAHLHVSFARDAAGFDSSASWGIATAGAKAGAAAGAATGSAKKPAANAVRVLQLTDPPMRGDDVRLVQLILAAWYGLPAAWADGVYGPATVEVVKRAQANTPPGPILRPDGVVGPQTYQKLGLL